MDRIFYAGESFLTGSSIAQALLNYAKALAENDSSETVDLPVREPDGSLHRTTFLIGPASQIIAEAEDPELDEVVDDELVAELIRKTALINGRVAMPVADAETYPHENNDPYEL